MNETEGDAALHSTRENGNKRNLSLIFEDVYAGTGARTRFQNRVVSRTISQLFRSEFADKIFVIIS